MRLCNCFRNIETSATHGMPTPLALHIYEQKIEGFKQYCVRHRIDFAMRRYYFYEFFTSEQFLASDELCKHYDFGIEDVCSVLWLNPQRNKEDALFLKRLHENYAEELKQTSAFSDKPSFLSLDDSTRFANNDIYGFIVTFKDKPAMLKLLKEILLYCILRDDKCDDRPFTGK